MPPPDKASTKKSSFLSSIGITPKKFHSSHISSVSEISESDAYLYGGGSTTIASLLGHDRRSAKDRQTIYRKWGMMESDPICSTALNLLVTSALGGHETSGDVIFIEKTAETKKDKQLSKMVDEISMSLSKMFNKSAFPIAYTGAAFGDSYARIYTDSTGVVDLYTDELVRPPLVQPFERGNRTIGYAVYIGKRNFERLDVSQMARLKMPRTQWVPQHGVVEKALRVAITENDMSQLPLMPSMAGGSLLYNAEEPYDNLYASIVGLVGQRWIDSIDEQMLAVNLTDMTIDQQEKFVDSIKRMLTASKSRAENAVKDGRPVLERIRHIIPTFNDKQVTTISNANGGQTGRTGTISIEDIILHARLLSGAIGVDLSMLGFADQLSGGLGEGGFFRTSAQAAERARTIRSAISDFFDHIIDIHTMIKYKTVFDQNKRPWAINFYGSISALESEKQRTRADSMNSGMLLAQAMQSMKDMGASEEIMTEFLTKIMMLDEDQAKLFAKIVNAKNEGDGGDDNHPFGGGGAADQKDDEAEKPTMDSIVLGSNKPKYRKKRR